MKSRQSEIEVNQPLKRYKMANKPKNKLGLGHFLNTNRGDPAFEHLVLAILPSVVSDKESLITNSDSGSDGGEDKYSEPDEDGGEQDIIYDI
ncbi:hypothetical protein FRC02_006936 [Tulasnella sp. 418]|nr:hypothetical protein FRC02_006936 [Tulasnella sp. 418]